MSTQTIALPALNQAHAEALAGLLRDYIGHQRQQHALVIEHRAAISQADTRAIAQCTQRHRQSADVLVQLESRRLSLIRTIVQGTLTVRQSAELTRPGHGSSALTFTALVQKCPPSSRPELLTLIDTLRELTQTVAREQAILRSATLSLLAHMQGLMERVTRSIAPGGAYRRPGSTGVGASSSFSAAVDLAC